MNSVLRQYSPKARMYMAGLLLMTLNGWADKAMPVEPYSSKTSSVISLDRRGDLIIATTITNWDPKASETLEVHWRAPKGGFCQNSTYTVFRNNSLNGDVSWSYRTVVHTDVQGKKILCDGEWVAEVVSRSSQKVLSASGYLIKPDNAKALSTTDS